MLVLALKDILYPKEWWWMWELRRRKTYGWLSIIARLTQDAASIAWTAGRRNDPLACPGIGVTGMTLREINMAAGAIEPRTAPISGRLRMLNLGLLRADANSVQSSDNS